MTSYTGPALTSASALLKEARASGVYAQRSSSGITVARRKLIALSTTLTSSCGPVRIPRRRRISAGRVSRPCSFTAITVLGIDLTLPGATHFANVTLSSGEIVPVPQLRIERSAEAGTARPAAPGRDVS